ncbi:MAG: BamA/TamA family outer membrane protein [Acidobacteriota bacterium]
MSRFWLLWLALCTLTASSALAQRVDSVELHLGPGLDPAEVSSLVEIGVGRELDSADVRRTLDNLATLFETSRASLWKAPNAAGGLAVHVRLEPKLQVTSVSLQGKLGLRREDVLAVIEQAAGAPLVEGRLVRSVFAVRELLERNGYLEATVLLDVDVVDASRADVVFRVDAGPRAEIVGASFVGDLQDIDAEELEASMKLDDGQRYSPRTERVARRRAQRWLHQQGLLEARLGEPRFDYSPEQGALVLTYEPALGERLIFEVIGLEREVLEREGLLPLDSEEAFDRSLLPRTERRVLDFLQGQGYFDARVELTTSKSESGLFESRLSAERGERWVLRDVSIETEGAIGSERLMPLVESSKRRRLAPSTGSLVTRRVETDRSNLRSFLIRQGFLEATVEPRIERLENNGLALFFDVAEGPRSTVERVDFDGSGVVGREAIEPRDGRILDGPYHPALRAEITGRLLERYELLGYRRPRIEVTMVEGEERRWTLDVQVDPGPQTVVDRIVIQGAGRTERDVILEAIGLGSEEPVSRADLLEAQRRLYRLGIFKSAEVRLGTRSATTAVDPVDRRDVLVELEEARRWRLGYGLGYDSDNGVRGLFSLTRTNLLQRGSTLRLDLNISEREERARLLFSDRPTRFLDLPVRYAVYRLEESFSSFDSERFGAQIESTLPLSRRLSLGLFYDYRIVNLQNDELLGESELTRVLDRELVDTEVSSLTTTLLYDRRDDPLDPSSGWSSALQVEGAFPLLEAEERFVKAFGQLTGYLPLGRLGVLAGSLRLGAIEPLGDDATSSSPLRQTVPISERFFAGGRTSHRAFRRDRLGIPGDTVIEGFEIGGEGLVLVNLDYRFPLAGPLGGTVFVDSGNVWATRGDVSTEDFRTGAGLGVRYRSPVGPLRLEVAWKLDPLPEESSPLFLVSFGHAF